ncbi:LPXTG cell wall anchor domain-containing protein [Macrococcoides canis]|uniref:LPXTG cell wall anchor domain-containing protein n=1 Tax=Macrococcoides canis TaxID=1855823 RepID=UPI0020B6AAEA|nr:LPXTG cell wall anchor domain-containing protein [Macrococcus canis]UTH10831.1 LPXTG cell wall anchor domain-containing protein [Macrococcus canis]
MKTKKIISTIVAVSLMTFPAQTFAETTQASKIDALKNEIETHHNEIDQNVNTLSEEVKANKENLQELKENTSKAHEAIQAKTEAISPSENHSNLNEKIDNAKKQLPATDLPRTQQLEINANKIVSEIDGEAISLSDKWLNNENMDTLLKLETLKYQQEISELEYRTKVLKVLNETLSNNLNETDRLHFNFNDLLSHGFNTDELDQKYQSRLNNLSALKDAGKLTQRDYNGKVFDLLHDHLQEGNRKLTALNNELGKNDISDSLASGFVNNLSAPVKAEPMSIKSNTNTLPESGEAASKPLMAAAVVILITGALILYRSRKKK